MSKLHTAFRLLKENKSSFLASVLENLNFLFPDKLYLQLLFRCKMGYKLNLKNPKSFSEKLQWLKLYNRNPLYTTLVDKYAVKQWVSDKIGSQYIVPTLGVWGKFDDIDFDKLPNQFVLKCTHDSGGLIICKDKSKLDLSAARKKIEKSLKKNFYYVGREWPYKSVPPRIIAEKYMEDETGGFVDYKFFCFNGVVDCVMVCLDRHLNDTKFYFFDEKWQLKRLNKRGIAAPEGFTIRKPACIDEMFRIAAQLSQGIPFVRVDLYECFGKVYFGEMTFFPDSGFDPNLLPETDSYFGKLIDLPQSVGDKK